MALTKVSCILKNPDCARTYQTGVSLHSHTRHSKEKLAFIPAFTSKWPVLDRALTRLCRRSLIPVDFSRGYWTPPLTPKMAFDLEKRQIEDGLGLASLVSLTDHDSIQAPSLLRLSAETAETPMSLEWSVPFGGAVFHLGVHNLPGRLAPDLAVELSRYTHAPAERQGLELLAILHEIPESLVVFNHPMWDLAGHGPEKHAFLLDQFLVKAHPFLHAMEFNGMRDWAENKRVVPLADRWRLPIVSGGDRHACEPSAVLNLTHAQSFAEFAREIRVEQKSHVLFMAQYSEPMCVRIMQSLLDVIRYYPEYPEGSRRWDDRVFHPDNAGVDKPLSSLWKNSPAFLERIFSLFRLVENTTVQKTLKRIYSDEMDVYALSDSPSEAIS